MSYFERSSHNVFYNPSFTENNYRGVGQNLGESCCSTCGSWLGANDDEGRRALVEASLFKAIYDSAAYEELEPSLPATQHGYLSEELDDFISGGASSLRVLVFRGPKSNLAHLCAERLEDKLCASFFVSQSLQTDDPTRFFPSIAWQLSIHFSVYSNVLEMILRRDPSLVHKRAEIQFRKLIFDPVRQLLAEGHDFGPRNVIVIDGIEKYAKAQTRLKTLRIILERAEELPFVWLIFGQPDRALDKQVMEMGSMAGILRDECRGTGTGRTRTFPNGVVCGFLLPHYRASSLNISRAMVLLFFFSPPARRFPREAST